MSRTTPSTAMASSSNATPIRLILSQLPSYVSNFSFSMPMPKDHAIDQLSVLIYKLSLSESTSTTANTASGESTSIQSPDSPSKAPLTLAKSTDSSSVTKTKLIANRLRRSRTSKARKVPKTFHGFPKLPIELRLKIWKMINDQDPQVFE